MSTWEKKPKKNRYECTVVVAIHCLRTQYILMKIHILIKTTIQIRISKNDSWAIRSLEKVKLGHDKLKI